MQVFGAVAGHSKIRGVDSLDICDKDRQKYNDVRSILKRNTIIFILVQAISNSNSIMFNFTVLYCKIRCLR
jgi:hypothetical protein